MARVERSNSRAPCWLSNRLSVALAAAGVMPNTRAAAVSVLPHSVEQHFQVSYIFNFDLKLKLVWTDHQILFSALEYGLPFIES